MDPELAKVLLTVLENQSTIMEYLYKSGNNDPEKSDSVRHAIGRLNTQIGATESSLKHLQTYISDMTKNKKYGHG